MQRVIITIGIILIAVGCLGGKYPDYPASTSIPLDARFMMYDPAYTDPLKDRSVTGDILFPWVDARAYATLALADAAAVSADKTLLISSNWAVTGDTTLSSSIQVVPGGMFTITSGKVLTINGAFSNPENVQVFTGSGTTAFGPSSVTSVCPNWWLKNTTPGTTDMTAAIQAAFNSGIPIVNLNKDIYKVSSVITLPNAAYGKLYGDGAQLVSSAVSGFILKTPSVTNYWHWTIEGIYFDGNSNQVSGLYIESWKLFTIRNCEFWYCNNGIELYNDAYYTHISNNKFRNCTTGVLIDADNTSGTYPNASVIDGVNSFELCGTGIDINKGSNIRVYGNAIELSTNYLIVLGAYAQGCVIGFNFFEGDVPVANIISGASLNVFMGNYYGMNVANFTGTGRYTGDNTVIEGPGIQTNGVPSDYGGAWDLSMTFLRWGGDAHGYQQTRGIGFTDTEYLEWSVNSGDGYGTRLGGSGGHWEIWQRSNSTTFVRAEKINRDTQNARIGDAVEPDASGGAKLSTKSLGLDILTEAPSAPRNGMIVYADGTSWNPGAGAGFYGYEGGLWVKL
jgi:hypothetical protein